MKVLVDTRLVSGNHGGVEQAIIGLADSFTALKDPEIEFKWLVYKNQSDWLIHHLPLNSELVELNPPREMTDRLTRLIDLFRESVTLQAAIATSRKYGPFKFCIADEPNVVSKINPDLIHFPLQFGFKTSFTNVYQPHDLQHFHLPEFFSKEALVLRKIGYHTMIKQSTRVIVGNEWTKRDVISKYSETRERIDNIPLFPQLLPSPKKSESGDLNFSGNKYFFYPASYWKHKNHGRLLHALAQVLEQEQQVDLILSGANLIDNSILKEKINRLGLKGHVHVAGFVSPSDLVKLYRGAKGVIIPSLFESASFPAWEAFSLGVPVAAARTTAIPEQVQDAALMFDPLNIPEIAQSMMTILAGGSDIQDRIDRGKLRVAQFTPQNTAIGFRYSYRRSLNLFKDAVDMKWEKEGIRF